MCLNFPQEILEHMLNTGDVHDNLQRDIQIWDCNLPEHLSKKCVTLEGTRPCWLLFSVVALLCLGGAPTDETPPCSFSRVRSKLPLAQKCSAQEDPRVHPNTAAGVAAYTSGSLASGMTACVAELVSSTDHTLLHDCATKSSELR